MRVEEVRESIEQLKDIESTLKKTIISQDDLIVRLYIEFEDLKMTQRETVQRNILKPNHTKYQHSDIRMLILEGENNPNIPKDIAILALNILSKNSAHKRYKRLT